MQKLFSLSAAMVILTGIMAALPLNAQSTSAAGDKAVIQAAYKKFADDANNRDVNGIMALYAPDVFVFDVIPPRDYPNWAAYKKDWNDLFATFPGPVSMTISDLHITVVGSVAYTRCIDDGTFTNKDGSKVHMIVRTTDVFRKMNGKWLIVLEHNSVPVDPVTGKADMLSKP